MGLFPTEHSLIFGIVYIIGRFGQRPYETTHFFTTKIVKSPVVVKPTISTLFPLKSKFLAICNACSLVIPV